MRNKASLYTPVLVVVVLILIGISEGFIDAALNDNGGGTNIFLSISLIQLFIFIIPCAFYCRVRNINFLTVSKFRICSPTYIPFIIFTSMLFLITVMIFNYFEYCVFENSYYITSTNLLNVIPKSDNIFVLLCYIVVPAVVEELLFRSILLGEYSSHGGFCAIMISSVFFAMLHLDFSHFLVYFFAGVIFGVLTYITSSTIPAILLHMLNNFITVFLQDNYINYISLASSSILFIFIMIAAFFVALFLVLTRLEYIFLKKADEFEENEAVASKLEALKKASLVGNIEGPDTRKEKNSKIMTSTAEIFLSPSFFLAVPVYVFLTADIFK